MNRPDPHVHRPGAHAHRPDVHTPRPDLDVEVDLDGRLTDLLMLAARGLRGQLRPPAGCTPGEGAADDLPPHLVRALRVFAHSDGLRASELARHLRVAPRSATEMVDGLQERGLVTREPDPTDRRATLVRATSQAEAVLAEAAERRRDAGRAVFARLEEGDRRELARLLGLVVEAEEQTGQARGHRPGDPGDHPGASLR